MEWQRVTNTEHKGWPAMWYLYQHSFPLSEQRTIQCQIEAMQDPQYHCYGLWEHDVFIGILMYWAWDNQQYIEHFAINPQLRGQGYGSIILKKLMDNQHTIILEIDPPIDEISIKRLHFYEQLGFQMNPYQHIQLAYQKDILPPTLAILSYPKAIAPSAYANFTSFSNTRIIRYCETS